MKYYIGLWDEDYQELDFPDYKRQPIIMELVDYKTISNISEVTWEVKPRRRTTIIDWFRESILKNEYRIPSPYYCVLYTEGGDVVWHSKFNVIHSIRPGSLITVSRGDSRISLM